MAQALRLQGRSSHCPILLQVCMPYLSPSSHGQVSRTVRLHVLSPWPHLLLNSQPTEIWLLLSQLGENCFLPRSPSTFKLPNPTGSWGSSFLTSQYVVPLTSWPWNCLLPLFPRSYPLCFSSFPTNCFFSVSFTGPSLCQPFKSMRCLKFCSWLWLHTLPL